MKFFSRFLEGEPDERWVNFPWLWLFALFFLAALGVLIWWMLDAGMENSETVSTTSSDEAGDDSESQSDHSQVIASSFSGESVEGHEKFGVVYRGRPDDADDLTVIKGVGPGIEGRLNNEGIYRFKQIANWDEKNAREFDSHLGFPGRVEREEWIPQAQGFAKMEQDRSELPEEPEPDEPSESDYEGYVEKYVGENVGLDRKLGVLFEAEANCEDDLTKIKGIGKVLSQTLNERGVYRFQQIADWNDYNVWSFNRIIAFPGRIQRDEWIKQAEELALTSRCTNPGAARVTSDDLANIIGEEFAGEDVEVREPFGIIYKSEPEHKDNLQDIKGVGPVLETKLHEFGVYRFKQIANWPDDAIDEFQEQLSFPDRIRRDDWVGQCLSFISADS